MSRDKRADQQKTLRELLKRDVFGGSDGLSWAHQRGPLRVELGYLLECINRTAASPE